MRIKEITVFWNNLVAVFGLSILSSTAQSWKINYFKIFWAVVVTILFSVWGFYQVAFLKNHSMIYNENCFYIVFIILGGNAIVNWVRISYLIKTKKLVDLYDRVVRFDDKHFGTSLVLWKSHTFRFLFLGFFTLIGYITFDFCWVTNSKEIIFGTHVFPAYFIVLTGQMSVFLIWARNILDRIQKDYLMDLDSGFHFYEDYLCKMPQTLKNRLFPVSLISFLF